MDLKNNYRRITLKTVEGTCINGKINIQNYNRVSDVFAASDAEFVVLVDAKYCEAAPKTMFVNKQHIVWVEPEE
ncbi:MAG: hypothetical protein ACD_62C00221G0004 [uncultured bacterium]|nr:MAG: hypothetical protein ACD_62C00221G0004 [uncultured bacterium]HLD44997.1 hypothetical protein [bacterium]